MVQCNDVVYAHTTGCDVFSTCMTTARGSHYDEAIALPTTAIAL